jgi:hypothetical protein
MRATTNPTWINGAEATAPGANTQLAKVVATAGRIGKLYGARIGACQEANAAGKRWQIRMNFQGTAVIIASLDVLNPSWISDYPLAILKGNGTDFFEIINPVAGTAACVHQASLLYDEEPVDAPVRGHAGD